MPLPSTSDGSAPDRVRLTVVSGTRRTDLVVPGAVPVAELLPALARGLGLLDVTTVHGGYRLITSEGRELGVDTGLVGQQVADGALLVLAARADEAPPRVYDDVVEAVADVVERELRPGARPRAGVPPGRPPPCCWGSGWSPCCPSAGPRPPGWLRSR